MPFCFHSSFCFLYTQNVPWPHWLSLKNLRRSVKKETSRGINILEAVRSLVLHSQRQIFALTGSKTSRSFGCEQTRKIWLYDRFGNEQKNWEPQVQIFCSNLKGVCFLVLEKTKQRHWSWWKKQFKQLEANESFTQQRVSLPEVIYTKEKKDWW